MHVYKCVHVCVSISLFTTLFFIYYKSFICMFKQYLGIRRMLVVHVTFSDVFNMNLLMVYMQIEPWLIILGIPGRLIHL